MRTFKIGDKITHIFFWEESVMNPWEVVNITEISYILEKANKKWTGIPFDISHRYTKISNMKEDFPERFL